MSDLKYFLDQKVEEFNCPSFIDNDPVSIPHLFTKKQDIEIAGFFAATLAWGQRKTIINKCHELLRLMDHAPHDFIIHHSSEDLKQLIHFKHRTFNATDLLYFVKFLKKYYKKNPSLEDAFIAGPGEQVNMEAGIIQFRNMFFELKDHPVRSYKHVSSPANKSACKRINMFLRWMARKDNKGVDFGIWKKINPSQLICPCDVHVDRVARKLSLIHRKQTDWQAALQLTENLKKLDPHDPVKYDFALFGLGVMEKF